MAPPAARNWHSINLRWPEREWRQPALLAYGRGIASAQHVDYIAGAFLNYGIDLDGYERLTYAKKLVELQNFGPVWGIEAWT